MNNSNDIGNGLKLRDYEPTDDPAVLGDLALAAWSEYVPHYGDWTSIQPLVANMSALANIGDIILCEDAGTLIGAVAYMPPFSERDAFFEQSWALIRMLVVAPDQRGRGIGRLLIEACIDRARRNSVATIGLHTSPMMETALSMYLRLGFEYVRDAPSETTFPYAVYALNVP